MRASSTIGPSGSTAAEGDQTIMGQLQRAPDAGQSNDATVRLEPKAEIPTLLQLSPEPASGPLQPRPLQILMAEDNPLNHRIVRFMLAKFGHTLTIVVNGRKAIEALERQPFDLVLMDLQMPEMDGLQATLAIRASEALTGRHVPIIALTANAFKEDRDRCMKAGMDDYLSKPFQSEKLREAIEFCLPLIREAAVVEPSQGPSTSPLDLATALDRVDGDRAFLGEMVTLFLEESPRLIAQIRNALDVGDAESLIVPSHNLKNWAGNFVATSTLAALERLESDCRAGKLVEAGDSFKELESEFERLTKALADFNNDRPKALVASLAGGDARWSPPCIL
jgi:two-component system sensor histidine kinase/response regulator